tara:strand:+ start:1807 stop:1935 length:129 start_codon:yes stop_codon:yes gene_type:complete
VSLVAGERELVSWRWHIGRFERERENKKEVKGGVRVEDGAGM